MRIKFSCSSIDFSDKEGININDTDGSSLRLRDTYSASKPLFSGFLSQHVWGIQVCPQFSIT